MFKTFVDCDEQVATELEDWCQDNLYGYLGLIIGQKGGFSFYFDSEEESQEFEQALENLL